MTIVFNVYWSQHRSTDKTALSYNSPLSYNPLLVVVCEFVMYHNT